MQALALAPAAAGAPVEMTQKINLTEEQTAILDLLCSENFVSPDVVLKFDVKPGELQISYLPAHLQMLRMYSQVLRDASREPMSETCEGLTAAEDGIGVGRRWPGLPVLRLPGTTAAEWLTVAQFMCPVVPEPRLGWRNIKSMEH